MVDIIGEDPTAGTEQSGCFAEGPITSRVSCILSYNGSTTDVVINYALFVINLIACFSSAVAESQKKNGYTHKKTDEPSVAAAIPVGKTAGGRIGAFTFVWGFQIGLCLLLAELADNGVGCAGISIVWCAMFGWLWSETRTHQQSVEAEATGLIIRKIFSLVPQSRQHKWLAVLNASAIAYYAITEDAITTVAHLCAILMGALLEWLACFRHDEVDPAANAKLLQHPISSTVQQRITTTCNIDLLDTDTVSLVLGFLQWKDILRARVCKKFQEAAMHTNVPRSVINSGSYGSMESWNVPEIFVKNRDVASALTWISRALPQVQELNFDFSQLKRSDKFDIAEGENPELWRNSESDKIGIPLPHPPVDVSPISNFYDLRRLKFRKCVLNGSYPFLFQFQKLETLELDQSGILKFDLADLAGLPSLKRLQVVRNGWCTGSLCSIKCLRLSLEEIYLVDCNRICGSLHDLADFPKLEKLDVSGTKVTGDIRNIAPGDFVSLTELEVGAGVYGGADLDRIRDAESLVLALYKLKKRSLSLFKSTRWRVSCDSPDWFAVRDRQAPPPPFFVEFVVAGPRIGWRWTNCESGGSCETLWLDSEPSPTDDGYGDYVSDVERATRDISYYRGYSRPPTHEEYREICEFFPMEVDGDFDFWAGDLLEE